MIVLDESRPWRRRDLLETGTQRLQAAGVPEARRNSEWMLEAVLDCSRALLYAYPERLVPRPAVAAFGEMLARRLRREPLQYVVGFTDFYGLRLQVTPDVLIPRPETEQVVEAALALLRPLPSPRVLDVGTGSGCIPLALRQERPDAEVYACDVSPAALAVARANAEAAGLPVTFFEADVLAPSFTVHAPAGLDLLISNPPYIPQAEAETLEPEVRAYEPALALFAGDDPLRFYRVLVRHAGTLLRPGGLLVLETHADYGRAVCDLMQAAGLRAVRLANDLAGYPRIASGRR